MMMTFQMTSQKAGMKKMSEMNQLCQKAYFRMHFQVATRFILLETRDRWHFFDALHIVTLIKWSFRV